MIDFISNDFLGFARSQTLLKQVHLNYEAYCQEFPHALLGSRGGRKVLGETALLAQLEEKIASKHQSDAALVVASGYVANFGLSTHLAHTADAIFFDEASHLSVTHSLSYCSHRAIPFKHNDLDHCAVLLEEARKQLKQNIFICITSIYSCTGTQAPIKEFLSLAQHYGAHLIVDEAHAMGLCGVEGKGLCYGYGYQNFYAVLVTYGKAMGCVGAAILSSQEVKTQLCKEPPLSYSTMMSPYTLVAVSTAYDFLDQEGEARRQRVHELQEYFMSHYRALFGTPSKPIYIHPQHFEGVCKTLQHEGLEVGTVAHPTTPLLRVHVHAYNTESEIDHLMGVFQTLKEQEAIFHMREPLCGGYL